MDEHTRGFIEKAIDEAFEANITDGMRWVQDVLPIKSVADLALGYVIGTAEKFASSIVVMATSTEPTEEDYTEIRNMLERRLPEIVERINRELNI